MGDVLTPDATGWMAAFAALVDEQAADLTELDRLVGDGDHGTNLQRGLQAVTALDATGLDAADYLRRAGTTLLATVGGASGPLYGSLLLRAAPLAAGHGDDAAGVAAFWRTGLDAVRGLGRAGTGDKTMVDALLPAVEAMEATTGTAADAYAVALPAARAGRDATGPMVARKGRAAWLGDRSAGVLDPGACSAVLLLEAAATTLVPAR